MLSRECRTLAITAILLIVSELYLFRAPALAKPILFENTWMGFNMGNYQNCRFLYAAAIGDFDGDDYPDVVAARWPWATGFACILNEGNGTFGQLAQYSSSLPALDICIGDFDGDDYADVVVPNSGVNWEGNTVSFFRNEGDGSFAPQQQFSAGSGPVGVAVADFDNDSDLDLVVADYGYLGSGNSVSLLLNNGNGSFQAPQEFSAGASPYKLAAADLNGDGFPDLAVAREEQMLSVLLNDGSGAFDPPVTYNIFDVQGGDFFPTVAAADMDNDGDIDLMYGSTRTWINFDRGVIALSRNLGEGNFSPFESIPLVQYTAGPVDLDAADLNGDGWIDAVGASYDGTASDGLQVALSDGSGGFLPAVKYPGGQTTVAVMAADADLDGDIDLLSADNYSMEVTVHLNPGNGQFPLLTTHSTESLSSFLDAADIDSDGDLDVVTSASGVSVGLQVAVLRNGGDATFEPRVIVPRSGGGAAAKLRDLNGDGFVDLLAMSPSNSTPYDFHTATNLGDGTFSPFVTWPVGSCGWGDIDAFDLDNDGDLDVCLTEYLACPGEPDSGRRLYISLNDGTGEFPETYIVVISSANPYAIVGGDFNVDGNIDLATAHYGVYGANNWIEVHLGDGLGNFLSHTVYVVGQGPYDIMAADFNSDGSLDLATCNNGSGGSGIETMSVLLGNGDGTFQTAQTYDGSYSSDLLGTTGITAGDIDYDGDLDLIVANAGSNDMSLYFNNGQGQFQFDMRYGLHFGASSPFCADFDGDNVLDVAACVALPPGGFVGAVVVARGSGTQGSPCGSYVLGDFNGSEVFNIADIVAAFSKLKTGQPEPALLCECPAGSGDFWAVAMDVNNSCGFNIADIVSAFSKLKTGLPELIPCELCPPGGR